MHGLHVLLFFLSNTNVSAHISLGIYGLKPAQTVSAPKAGS